MFHVPHAACIRKARSGSSGKLQPSPWMWYGFDARIQGKLKYCSHQNYEMEDVSGMWCLSQT